MPEVCGLDSHIPANYFNVINAEHFAAGGRSYTSKRQQRLGGDLYIKFRVALEKKRGVAGNTPFPNYWQRRLSFLLNSRLALHLQAQ